MYNTCLVSLLIIFTFAESEITTTDTPPTPSIGPESASGTDDIFPLVVVIIILSILLAALLIFWAVSYIRRRRRKVTRRRAESYPPKDITPATTPQFPSLPNIDIYIHEGIQLAPLQKVRSRKSGGNSSSHKHSSSSGSSSLATSIPSLPPTAHKSKRSSQPSSVGRVDTLPSLPSSSPNSSSVNSAFKRFERNMMRVRKEDMSTVPSWRAPSESSSDKPRNRYAISEYSETDKHCKDTPGAPESAPSVHSSDRASLFGPEDWRKVSEFNRCLNALSDPSIGNRTPGGFEHDPGPHAMDLESVCSDDTLIKGLYGSKSIS